MKKKLIGLVVAGILTMTGLVGCSGAGAEQTEAPKQEAQVEVTEGKDGLKIAIVTSITGVDDGNFNENNYNGILKFLENNPASTVTAIQEPTGDTSAAVQAVSDIVADYDVIVTPGFQFAGISTIANENPDKKFILVDSEPAAVDDQTVFDNVYSMLFAEQEGGFFAGVAAALETQTNKVAVVNGIAFPSNVNYQYGFESGVNYVNEVFGKNVELVELPSYAGTDVTGANVGGNYVGDFADESTGKVIGSTLIKEGCDIIFVAAGGAGNGVFTAAKEAGNVKVIGCDVDQFDDGQNGDANIILTSALKVMDANVERVLQSVVDGTFKGANELRQADTDSTGYVKEEGRHQLSEDTLAKMEEIYALVKEGEVVPAANFNGVTPESFPGLPSYK
ncbi:MAG: BMP family ABC transporter substrate-binding protein [Clostridiales bacterium]|nr:BMP family ABC transporter substrate-binding protein [Clostridiales bacterium]